MTEKEAWLEIAHRFSLAKPVIDETCGRERWNAPTDSVTYGFGICAVIVDLLDTGRIDKETAFRMGSRLQLYRGATERHSLYIWPLDRDGALARAEFCKTQGEQC